VPSAGGRARRERLLARVKLVQQQLAAAAEAAAGPAPAPAQLGAAARPHGLTRITSLGARRRTPWRCHRSTRAMPRRAQRPELQLRRTLAA